VNLFKIKGSDQHDNILLHAAVHLRMIPKEYTSAAGVSLPEISSSGGIMETVPYRRVDRWLCGQWQRQQ
jgi:hypothetical protein